MNLLASIYVKMCSNSERISFYRRKGMIIGDNCHISGNVRFGSEPYLIRIGNGVRITSNVQFVTHDGGLWVLRNIDYSLQEYDIIKPIIIGNNVHIGIGSTIMPGVRVGDNVIIGCSSVVTHDVPNNSVVAGVPAKVIRSLDEYREKNKKYFISTKNISKKEKKTYLTKYFEGVFE